MGRKDKILVEYREKIKELAYCNRVKKISLSGSVARGEDGPDSDYDFLVEPNDNFCSQLDLIGLRLDLEELLGSKVDVVSDSEYLLPPYSSIRDDAITL